MKKRQLIMPEWEIAEYYRDAADKKRQIEILADMNLTTVGVIRELLEGLGYEVPEQKTRKASDRRLCISIEDDIEGDIKSQIMSGIESLTHKSVLDCEKAVDLYLANKTDEEIGEQLGVSKMCVYKWRTNRGIPTRHTRHNPQKKKEDPQAERKKMVKLIRAQAESIADCLLAMGLVVKEAGNG